MKHTLAFVTLALGIVVVTPALAADVYHNSTTQVQQDSSGNYNATTSRNRMDANGNVIRVDSSVNADAAGNANVSKRVESDSKDIIGGSHKTVTNHAVDTNGREKVTTYQEHSN